MPLSKKSKVTLAATLLACVLAGGVLMYFREADSSPALAQSFFGQNVFPISNNSDPAAPAEEAPQERNDNNATPTLPTPPAPSSEETVGTDQPTPSAASAPEEREEAEGESPCCCCQPARMCCCCTLPYWGRCLADWCITYWFFACCNSAFRSFVFGMVPAFGGCCQTWKSCYCSCDVRDPLEQPGVQPCGCDCCENCSTFWLWFKPYRWCDFVFPTNSEGNSETGYYCLNCNCGKLENIKKNHPALVEVGEEVMRSDGASLRQQPGGAAAVAPRSPPRATGGAAMRGSGQAAFMPREDGGERASTDGEGSVAE